MVDKTKPVFHNPADKQSSPYVPQMAHLVIYRDMKRGHGDSFETWPAIITRTYENDRVDLTVFTTNGIRHVMRVAYNSDDSVDNSWTWPAESVRKPLNMPEAEKPVAKPVLAKK